MVRDVKANGPREGSGKLPAVLVVHENRGLNPYIEDVVRRLAVADFLAFGPDALTPVGGYPGSAEAQDGGTVHGQGVCVSRDRQWKALHPRSGDVVGL